MTFAVCVNFGVKDEMVQEFLEHMYVNARASLETEAGCLQFDVLTDPSRPTAVFLYELYSSQDSFKLHMETAHFLSFDAKTSNMIATKAVDTYQSVVQ